MVLNLSENGSQILDSHIEMTVSGYMQRVSDVAYSCKICCISYDMKNVKCDSVFQSPNVLE